MNEHHHISQSHSSSARTAADVPRGEAKIDYALKLALESSPALCRLLIEHVGWQHSATYGDVAVTANRTHGAGDSVGETDLLIEFANGCTVLCENKFSADFQIGQGRRYRQRVADHLLNRTGQATSIICAPLGYLKAKAGHPEMVQFEHRISIQQWISWIGTLDRKPAPVATALKALQNVASDWESDAFQGVKGTWPNTHQCLSESFAAVKAGWYVIANAGDWVHIRHPDFTGIKFHYRNNNRAVSLELTKRASVLPQEVIDDARRLNMDVNRKGNVAVKKLMLSQGIVSDRPTPQDVAEIIRSLEALSKWLLRWSIS